MASIRLRRVAEQIQEEIGGMLIKGLKDPRIGFVTITGVDLSPDLSKAWVYYCTPGGEAEREQSAEGLNSAAGFIRKTLGKRLHLKNIPELQFEYDTSLDRGDRIERLLGEVRQQEGWDDPTRVRGSPEEIAEALQRGRRFLVVSHTNPDGDAVGATLAMGRILDKLGKDVVMYNQDAVPHNFRFLSGTEQLVSDLEHEAPFDTTVVLDCSDLERVGRLPPREMLGRLVSVDHHLTAEALGEAVYLDPNAAAIGELLTRILPLLPVELDAELATQIYTTLLTDTGSFRYSNTSPGALRAAADMVAAGVSPWDVALEVYESQPLGRIELLAEVLPTLRVEAGGRFGSIVVTRDMFERTGTNEEHIDGFINYPRSIEGVEVSVQFREIEPRQYKISFRSRGNVNVAAIAARFGGGGHANAAGCMLDEDLDGARQRIRQAVSDAMDETLGPQERDDD